MEPMLQIRCKNNKKKVEVPLGCNLLDVYRILNLRCVSHIKPSNALWTGEREGK